MNTLTELREDLKVTSEDIDAAVSPELKELMKYTSNAGFSIVSDYSFRCACCSAIDGRPVFYELVKENVGPLMYGRKIDVMGISSVEGIVRTSDLGSTPEYDSIPHMTKDGLVCDHCYDTCYSAD